MKSQSQSTKYELLFKEAIKFTFIYSMEFEEGMQQILGHRANHAADLAGSPSAAKKLLLQATKKLSTRVDEIVTMDARLRERLISDFDDLKKTIDGIDKTPFRIHLIGLLFKIISRLLGFDWMDGSVYRTPIYYRTKTQEFEEHVRHMKHWRDWENEENELVLQRRKICLQLKEEGLHKNQIARALNISEYEVDQLIKDKQLAEITKLIEKGYPWEEVLSQFQMESSQKFSAFWKRKEAASKRRLTD